MVGPTLGLPVHVEGLNPTWSSAGLLASVFVRSRSGHRTDVTLHIGKRTIVVQTDLLDDQDRSVALVIQTQGVLERV